jgi:2-hydroxy-3-oxopropionate reductase
MKIGFIGLGIMGKPMVRNLLKAGYEVLAFSRTQADIEISAADGAQAAESIAQVAKECRRIITMLPDGPDVRNVVFEALEYAAEGTIIVDMSSIAPAIAQEVHAACAARGVKMLDAPVSGGEPKAIDGSLSIMVGGCEAVFNEVYGILMSMGASAVYCGEIGAGNTTKLANQIIVALNIAAVSEALTLSAQAGVAPDKVFAAIKGGLAGSTVMNAKVPMILEGNFEPGFKIDLHIKDLANAINTGHEVGAPLPFTAQVMEILQTLKHGGHGQKDHSAIFKYYQKLLK